MKILVLQLARLGDIFISWPALRALRRSYPDAQIDLMVRPRFEGAAQGLEAVTNILTLPTAWILEPLVSEVADDSLSLRRLDEVTEKIRKRNYDLIINLTFSPFSSFFVHSVAGANTSVLGYSRHRDGYLKIEDDVSSFFYAQAGISRPNRIHLSDIFATMINVDLIPEDWRSPENINKRKFHLPENYIVAHIGASDTGKTLSPVQWGKVFNEYSRSPRSAPVVLIGGEADVIIASCIEEEAPNCKFVNLVGKTQIFDLFSIVSGAQALIGGDSVAMHVASLTNTRCLNISIPPVNFWETGPRAKGSIVIRLKNLRDFVPEIVAQALADLSTGIVPEGFIRAVEGVPSFLDPQEKASDRFAWELVSALYLGTPAPLADDLGFVQAIEKLAEANEIAIKSLSSISDGRTNKAAEVLDRVDEIFAAIGQISEGAGVFTRWIATEKTRIGPDDPNILARTLSLHQQLGALIKIYRPKMFEVESGGGNG
ncbi:MAG: glycosyltransferase family 9 protein [Bdellovibrionaceae bacterium]|nr:glycosyltransferase family 9 protein [Pseudobdellovibrionaceae bacterium]